MKRGASSTYTTETKYRRTQDDESTTVRDQTPIDMPLMQFTPHFQQISGHEMGDKLLDAVRDSSQKGVYYYISEHQETIPYGHKGWALGEAAKNGDLRLTTYLLATVLRDIAPGHLKYAMEIAAQGGHFGIANMIEEKFNQVTDRPKLK